jgi:carboxyl-terminal processing protease
MPRRNLLILLSVIVVALLCRERVQTTYARVLGGAMQTIEDRALFPVGQRQLFEGAMDGMLDQLDDHSIYLSPAHLKKFHEQVDLQFAGVGIEPAIDPKTKELKVLSPLANSPAARAGIVAGDRILQIDKTATRGMSLADASRLLRGKQGTPVSLTVLHSGETKPVEIRVVREDIQADSVRGDTRNADGSWNFFLDGHDRIGYLRLPTTFSDNTVNELRQALAWMTQQGLRGLVLDLRDNPGGYLDAAVDVCDLLVRSGDIVTTRDREGHISASYAADGNAPFTDFPIAVVVNGETASAAEIVAACLQDHHRAAIVGQRTFGKGTVQDLIDLNPGCGAMKLTTKSYWRPSGKDIQRPKDATAKDDWGVSPDKHLKVVLNDEETDLWRQWRLQRDLPPASHGDAPTVKSKPYVDRQLARAVECVEQEAAKCPRQKP